MRVWVDITGLPDCAAPSGVPHTIGSLVRAWTSGNAGVRYCVFQTDPGRFTEFPQSRIVEWLARSPACPQASPEAGGSACPGIKAFLKPATALLPGWVRRGLRAGVRSAASLGLVLARWPRRERRASQSGDAPVDFQKDDVLLAPGWSWEFDRYGEVVEQQKALTGLSYVPLIYDLIPVLLPQLFEPWLPLRFERWAARTLQAADLVVTISQNSRRDILRFARSLGAEPPPVAVIRLGDCPPEARDANCSPPAESGLDGRRPFVMMVGTVEPRKNHLAAYHVWRRLVELRGERVPRLLVIGRAGWMTEELRYQIQNDPLVRNHITFLSRVSEPGLEWLYRNCLFTIYPSHYEGWGLPVAESLARGKYCVASGVSSIPEIGGDLVGYHDPIDAIRMLNLVEHATFDAAFRACREGEIQRRYRTTNWAQTASRLLALVHDRDRTAPRETGPGTAA